MRAQVHAFLKPEAYKLDNLKAMSDKTHQLILSALKNSGC
jgi:hypothetical protein